MTSVHIDDFLGLKTKQDQEPKQSFNPDRPEGSEPPSARRPRRKAQGKFCLKQGELDAYTTQLLGWVAQGCLTQDWEALLSRQEEATAPPWLQGEALGLDDLSHRILALALAHLVHLQGGLENSPFDAGEDLDGACLLRRLALVPPQGVWEVAQRLALDAPLRTRGYLQVVGDWSRRRNDKEKPISVTRLMRTDISLGVAALGGLLGLAAPEEPEVGPTLEDMVLPPAVRGILDRLLLTPPKGDAPFRVHLRGPAQSGRRSLAEALARQQQRVLKQIMAHEGHQPGAFLLLDVEAGFDEDDWNRIKDHPGWIFFRRHGAKPEFDPEPLCELAFDLEHLEPEDRTSFAGRTLQSGGPILSQIQAADLTDLDFTPGALVASVQRLARTAVWEELGPAAVLDRLKAGLVRTPAHATSKTAKEEVQPKRSASELCLTPAARERFHRIIQAIQGRREMLAQWNLDPGLVGRAQGILLFHGPSGTGKSMAAEVLAHELGMPLWRMEASELESPYVGESEAKLHAFFAQAKGQRAVLLLDEADTVLMDRGATEGSTKRYQDNLVNTWLRELDRFEGILVLTTNHAEGLDPAVERRIQFRMAFDPPTAEVRAQIWKTLLGDAPIPGREGLDFAQVADRYPLSGGRIRNAFLDACQRAAAAGAMTQDILVAACEEESKTALPAQTTRTIHGFAAHT